MRFSCWLDGQERGKAVARGGVLLLALQFGATGEMSFFLFCSWRVKHENSLLSRRALNWISLVRQETRANFHRAPCADVTRNTRIKRRTRDNKTNGTKCAIITSGYLSHKLHLVSLYAPTTYKSVHYQHNWHDSPTPMHDKRSIDAVTTDLYLVQPIVGQSALILLVGTRPDGSTNKTTLIPFLNVSLKELWLFDFDKRL